MSSTIAYAENSDKDIYKTLYKVGPNDVIQIKVIGHEHLDTTVTVAADGSITFPYIGTVYIKGMTLSQVTEEITKRLKEGYIRYPVVTAFLVRSLSTKIFTYGELRVRGELPYEDDMTLLRALSTAGGITEDGIYGAIKLKRKEKGKYVESYIGTKQEIENTEKGNLPMQVDDILIVERNKTFFIYGEVGRTGEFVLEKDMTVTRALSVAGGVREDGLYGKVKLRRKQEDGTYKDIEIDLKGTIEGQGEGDVLIQPDDILIVERNKTFLIYGEVNKQGEFVLQDNMTVFKAITVAGGFTKWGSESKVRVLRQTEDGSGLKTIKVNINDVIKGNAAADIFLNPNDVVVVSSGIF
jgi:polysaccharide export outer membrane protein